LNVVPAAVLPMPLEIVERLRLNRILLDCRHRHPLAGEKWADAPSSPLQLCPPMLNYTKYSLLTIQTFRKQSSLFSDILVSLNGRCANGRHPDEHGDRLRSLNPRIKIDVTIESSDDPFKRTYLGVQLSLTEV